MNSSIIDSLQAALNTYIKKQEILVSLIFKNEISELKEENSVLQVEKLNLEATNKMLSEELVIEYEKYNDLADKYNQLLAQFSKIASSIGSR
jgi:hypothetical protein